MTLITIDPEKCNHDGLCVQACPVTIISMEKGKMPAEIPEAKERCIQCGHCVAVCPENALTNSLMPREDFLPVPGNRPGADEVEALLFSRRSIRGFKKAPVPREQLERLLEVSRRAPTASNSQQVSWTMVLDPQRLDRIRELTEKWMKTTPRLGVYSVGLKQGKDMVLRGGTALAVAYGPADYVRNDTDCAIALTYMELMASAMGIGACWGGLVTSASWQDPELAEILGVPEGQRVGGTLMLGQPRQRHHLIPPRNPVKATWL